MSEQSKGETQDALLRRVVAGADDGNGVGITLFVSGLMISGQLIGIDEYLEAIAAGALDELRKELSDDPGPGSEPVPSPPQFLHLKDVRVGLGNSLSPLKGGFWRGRIDRVDGFIFGTASTERTQ